MTRGAMHTNRTASQRVNHRRPLDLPRSPRTWWFQNVKLALVHKKWYRRAKQQSSNKRCSRKISTSNSGLRTITVHLSASIVRVYSSCQMSLKVAPNFTTTSMRRKQWRNHGMLRKKTPLTTARSNYSMIQTANSRNATQRQSRSGLKSIGNGRGKTKVRLRHSGSAGRMLIQSKLLKPPCRNNS